MCEIFTLNSRETHSREINVNKFTWNSLNAKFTWNSRVFHVKLNVKFTWSSFHVNFTWGTIGCVCNLKNSEILVKSYRLTILNEIIINTVTFKIIRHMHYKLWFQLTNNLIIKSSLWFSKSMHQVFFISVVNFDIILSSQCWNF